MLRKVSIKPLSYYRVQTSRVCCVLALSGTVLLGGCDTRGIEWPDVPGLRDLNKKEAMSETTSHMSGPPNMAPFDTPAPPPPEMPAAPAPQVATAQPIQLAQTAQPMPESAPEPPPEPVRQVEQVGFSATPPSKQELGYNPKNIFAKNLRSDDERLDRLERAVQDMRNEFDSVRPAIRRLMAVESDIQSLLDELRQLSDNPSVMADNRPATRTVQTRPPVQAASKPMIIASNREDFVAPVQPVQAPPKQTKTATSYQKKSPPPVSGGQPTIYDVRVGEHPGKSRIVLDSNTNTGFNVDIDNNEKIMVVELPNSEWTASTAKSFGSKSPLISSYSVEESENGHILIFQLKKTANVVYQDEIAAYRGPGRRVVIDLSS
jgi:hypothetical protein